MTHVDRLSFAPVFAALILAASAIAQTPANISIVQGNGQLICDGCSNDAFPNFDAMVVQVTDANNNPVPNAVVTWAITSANGGSLLGGTTTTTGTTSGSSAVLCNAYNTATAEAQGQTCNSFVESLNALTSGLLVDTVTASISNGNSVTFYLTQSPSVQATGGPSQQYVVTASLTSDSVQTGTLINGSANSVYPTPIKVRFQTLGGTPVGNVQVQLIPDPGNLKGGPTVSCQTPAGSGADPGSVLSDPNTGIATCNVVFGPTPGSAPAAFWVLTGGVASFQNPNNVNNFVPYFVAGACSSFACVGTPDGFNLFQSIQVTATPDFVSKISIVSGNNQSANPGQGLAQPLVATVLDASGNPVGGQTVTWSASPNVVTFSPNSSVSGTNGQVSTTATLSTNAVGPVSITARTTSNNQTITIAFTATANVLLTGLTAVPPTTQTAQVSTPFRQPLVVQVTPATPGLTVNFAITAGAATGTTLSAASATTQANGQASIAVTAGPNAGPVTVSATLGNLPAVVFSLTVTPAPPPVSAASFLNGAGFFPTSGSQQTALSPCSIGTMVVGSSLTQTTLPTVANLYAAPLQFISSPASITFPASGQSAASNAPILNITNPAANQELVTFEVPCEVAPGTYTVTLQLGALPSFQVQGVVVGAASPGIFEVPSSDGVRRAVLVRAADGSFVSLANPARRGDILRMYITGAGPVQPPLSTTVGASVPTPGVDALPVNGNQVIVGVNGVGVGGVSMRAAPDLIGVYEVTFTLPSDNSVHSGDNVLAIGIAVPGNPTQYQQPGGSKFPVQ